MKFAKLYILLQIVSFCILTTLSCNNKSDDIHIALPIENPRTTNQTNTPEYYDGIWLNNPDGEPIMGFKSGFIELYVNMAAYTGWGLIIGEGLPDSYDTLIESGVLPIILANRYTGNDIRSTTEYNPGDFFVRFPASSDLTVETRFYFGDKDYFYSSSTYQSNQILQVEGFGNNTTDGRTLFTLNEITESDFKSWNDPHIEDSRQLFQIPPDDEARSRIYFIYRCYNEILQHAGYPDTGITTMPDSFDGYIALIGRKNPKSWINPYTGDSMKEVPWTDVSVFYLQGESQNNPLNQFGEFTTNEQSDTELAGNYSFKIGKGPLDKLNAYAQFYFYLPDGSIAAYICFGDYR